MTREQRYRRYAEVPDPINEIAQDNPLLSRLVEEYVNGNIITLNELLCQMVVHLNRDWSRQRKDYIDYISMTSKPVIIP